MPPFFKAINIADLILVWSLQNKFMQGSEVTQPVKCLANKKPLLVISSQSPNEKSYWQEHCASLKKSNFLVLSSFLPAIFDFFELLLLYAARGSTTLWQCYDVILSSIRGQTIKNWCQFVNYSTWTQFGHVTLYFEWSCPVPTVWARTPGNYFIASSRGLRERAPIFESTWTREII